MQTITYRVDHERAGAQLNAETRRRRVGTVLLGVVFGVLCFVVDSLLLRIFFGLLSVFLVLPAGFLLWLEPKLKLPVRYPEDDPLELDQRGVAFHSLGRNHRLPWSEVSEFKLDRGRLNFRVSKALPSPPPYKGIVLYYWLFMKRFYSRGPLKNRVVVSDIYDTPLDDIAATLNAYRERALGGANGPSSPEQA